MSWEENLRIAVESRFKTQWNSSQFGKIIFGSNSDEKPPLSGPWCRLSITILDSQNGEIGVKFQKQFGIISVQCFVEKNSGESLANLMTGEVARIFQNQTFDKVQCYVSKPVHVGEDGNWYQKNAKINFLYSVFS